MAEERIDDERESELRVKLLKRLAVAGVMVTVLLGVLAFFDYLAKPEEPEAPVFTKPVPVPPKKEVSQPVKPNADLPEPPKPQDKPAEAPPKPEVVAQPAAVASAEEAPGKPVAKAAAERATPAEKAARTGVPVSESGKAPAAEKAVPEKTASESSAVEKGVPEGTAAPGAAVATPPPAPAATKAATANTTAAPPRPLPPTPLRLLRGYVVQAGVFSSARAAEELHAKLALNGIASTLEARVSVGPFKTREEAAAAQAKMKTLGIDGLLVPPAGHR